MSAPKTWKLSDLQRDRKEIAPWHRQSGDVAERVFLTVAAAGCHPQWATRRIPTQGPVEQNGNWHQARK